MFWFFFFNYSYFIFVHCVKPTGRGGFLWPGLNVPVIKDGARMSMSQRGEAEQQEVHAELGTDAESTYYGQTDFSFFNIWITCKGFFFILSLPFFLSRATCIIRA